MKHTRNPAPGQGAPHYHVIQFRPGVGVRIASEPMFKRVMPVPESLRNTKRGTVKGFSRESANRLRNLLFPLDYDAAFGIALTAPPWATVSPEKAFDAISRNKSRCAGLRALIWRKEVTAKGIPHYHAIVFLQQAQKPAKTQAEPAQGQFEPARLEHQNLAEVSHGTSAQEGTRVRTRIDDDVQGGGNLPVAGSAEVSAVDGPDFGTLMRVRNWLVTQWANALIPRLCPARVALCCTSAMKPANTEAGRDMVRAVNLGKRNLTLITSANAVQYLCDHTSKHKAYQAKTTGRAWGVWFKGRLPVLDIPRHNLNSLPGRIVRRIQIALGKMSRYWFKDESRPFGYRWSHPRRFSGEGKRVLFRPGAALAISRMVDYYLAGFASC